MATTNNQQPVKDINYFLDEYDKGGPQQYTGPVESSVETSVEGKTRTVEQLMEAQEHLEDQQDQNPGMFDKAKGFVEGKLGGKVKSEVTEVAGDVKDELVDGVKSAASKAILGTDITDDGKGEEKEGFFGNISKLKNIASTVMVGGTVMKGLSSFVDQFDDKKPDNDKPAETPADTAESKTESNPEESETKDEKPLDLSLDAGSLNLQKQTQEYYKSKGGSIKTLPLTDDILEKMDSSAIGRVMTLNPSLIPVGSEVVKNYMATLQEGNLGPLFKAGLNKTKLVGKVLPDKVVEQFVDKVEEVVTEDEITTERLGDAYETKHETIDERNRRMKGEPDKTTEPAAKEPDKKVDLTDILKDAAGFDDVLSKGAATLGLEEPSFF